MIRCIYIDLLQVMIQHRVTYKNKIFTRKTAVSTPPSYLLSRGLSPFQKLLWLVHRTTLHLLVFMCFMTALMNLFCDVLLSNLKK